MTYNSLSPLYIFKGVEDGQTVRMMVGKEEIFITFKVSDSDHVSFYLSHSLHGNKTEQEECYLLYIGKHFYVDRYMTKQVYSVQFDHSFTLHAGFRKSSCMYNAKISSNL